MPSFNQSVLNANDLFVNANGAYNVGGTALYGGHLGTSNYDFHAVVFFPFGSAVPRYQAFTDSTLIMRLIGAPNATADFEVRLDAAVNPTLPGSNAAVFARTLTTARTLFSMGSATPTATDYSFDLAPMLNELSQKGEITGIVVYVRSAEGRTYTGKSARATFAASESSSAVAPRISLTYNPPPAVTAQGAVLFPPPVVEGEALVGSGAIIAEGTVLFPPPVVEGEALVGTPPAVVAQGTVLFPPPVIDAYGGYGDPKKNTLFTFERFSFDTHHFVTESGEVYGFTGQLPTVLGGVRDAMAGNADDAWIPEAGTRTRVAGSMGFSAVLFERDHPKRDGDVLERILPDVREIHFPDGRVLEVWDVLLTNRPAPNRLELTARPRGSVLTQALDKAELVAAFKTEWWTPELPVYAIDAGGGITAPLSVTQVDRGALGFAVRLEERGVLPLASIGRPIESDGSSHPSSLTLSYQDKHLHTSLRGDLTRIRELALGPFGEVLVLLLMWTRFGAHLLSCSSRGVMWHELPIGAPLYPSQSAS